MAIAALADMIVPTEFNEYVEVETTKKSRLFQSGIIEDVTEVIDSQIEGKTVNMPFFNDLDVEDGEVVLNDTVDLTVSGVTTSQDVAVKCLRGKAFGATDLAADLSGADPVTHIGNRFANYWAIRYQRALLATLTGAMGAASMSDNVVDITALTGGAQYFDADAFIDAVYTLGDESGGLSAVAQHSLVTKAMIKADLIDFIPDSQGKLTIPTYMGKIIIEDDGMPVSGSGADRIFTQYIFGTGAIGYGSKAPRVPVETERQALKGMGQEYLVHRKQWVLHPRGIKWVGSSVGPTPTNAELATSTNWQRVYENKLIRIVKHNFKIAP